jgi:serine/threonine protein kinase
MRSVRHPHCLTFYGAGVNSDDQAYLVTELMVNGSLKYILRDRTKPLLWSLRIQIAADIAAGMRYLHEIGTVHRDLKGWPPPSLSSFIR